MSLERRLRAVKEGVSLLTVAQDLEPSLKKKGQRWRGKCPLCENGEHSDAFSVDADKGLFYCFACGVGGDVITLVQAWGPFDFAEAIAWIGHTYNLDLPDRPDQWYARQDRQARLREKLEAERREVKRRRLFKYFILPELEKVAEPDRANETRIAWERFKQVTLG